MGDTHWERHLEAARVQKSRIRMVRSELQAGVLTLSQALADPAVRGLTVGRVVQWLPRYGPLRTERALASVKPFPVSPVRRCGELTPRQRTAIQEAV